MKKSISFNVLSLVWNLLLVYVCYTLSRLVFLCVNWDTFSEHLTFGYAMSLFGQVLFLILLPSFIVMLYLFCCSCFLYIGKRLLYFIKLYAGCLPV